jgi:uncharacterized protein (UPF0332 family)
MREMNFLAKLVKQKKIQLVEPSNTLKDAYIERSEESMRSAKALLQIDSLKDSVALTYYSMYYSLLALLFRVGIKCENHTGAILLLLEIFEIDNTQIISAKKERVDKQYYVDFSITKQEVNEMIRIAHDFNAELFDIIERINQTSVEKYRQAFTSRFS